MEKHLIRYILFHISLDLSMLSDSFVMENLIKSRRANTLASMFLTRSRFEWDSEKTIACKFHGYSREWKISEMGTLFGNLLSGLNSGFEELKQFVHDSLFVLVPNFDKKDFDVFVGGEFPEEVRSELIKFYNGNEMLALGKYYCMNCGHSSENSFKECEICGNQGNQVVYGADL